MDLNKDLFYYTDIHRAVGATHYKWKRIKVSNVRAAVDKLSPVSDHIYTTVQRFSYPEPTDNEPEFCPMPFDFDCATNVDLARQDTIKLVDYIATVYGIGINPEEMMLYFSGNRGFHVTINADVFEASPMVEMIKVYRIIAERLAKELKLATLDRAVYTKRRAWRVPNTKHGKTGLYKIPLELYQLHSGMKEILILAAKPNDNLLLDEVI